MEAPPSIKIGVPGAPNSYSYPSGDLPNQAGHTAGEDLFAYLYGDATLPGHENPLLPPTFIRETGGSFAFVPVADLQGGVASNDYKDRVAKIKNKYDEKVVPVYQRGYGVTNAKNKRYLIATCSIALCIGVLIYDPVSKTAAFTHVDKDQNFDSLMDIFMLEAFRSKDLQVHFYGGSAAAGNMFQNSRNTATGLLNACFKYNSSDAGRGRLTICAFDVMKQPHDSSFTFDTSTGQKYCNFWPMVNTFKGYPLDSKFRYWPDGIGRYFAEATDSQMAQLATDLPVEKKAIKDYEAKIRRQWDGTPTGRNDFVTEVNYLICKLVIQNALPNGAIPGVDMTSDAGKKTNTDMIQYLFDKNQPMAFEQGLKTWRIKWADVNGADRGPAANAILPPEAAGSIVGAVNAMLVQPDFAGLAPDAKMKRFQKAVDAWAADKNNKVSFEGQI
jgi:hypothetical protein